MADDFRRGVGMGCGMYVGWILGGLLVAALGVGAMVLCCGGLSCAALNSPGIGTGKTGFPAIALDDVISADQYSEISEGMTYDEVFEIVGSHGEELASSHVARISTKSFSWKNLDGSNMLLIFQNGRVVTKAQSRLPPLSKSGETRLAKRKKEIADERERKRKDEAAAVVEEERKLNDKIAREKRRAEQEEREAAEVKHKAETARRAKEEADRPVRDEKDAAALLDLAKRNTDQTRRAKALRSLIDQYPKTKAADEARKLLK